VEVIGVAAFIVVGSEKFQAPDGSQRCASFTK